MIRSSELLAGHFQELTGYGHVLTLYEKTLDFEKKEKSEFFSKMKML